MIEQDRTKITKDISNDDDDIDLDEKIERDGECKLCGCNHHISSMRKKIKLLLFIFNSSSSSDS
jgi:hypothetical protein